MILDASTMQYWHSKFNHMFFENALEPAIIKIYPGVEEDKEGTQALFMGNLEPFVIAFYYDISNAELTTYTLTVLLHEMVHQYCAENEIEDIDGFEHSDDFREEAENHGLTMDGYALAAWAQDAINKQIKLLDCVSLCCDRIYKHT